MAVLLHEPACEQRKTNPAVIPRHDRTNVNYQEVISLYTPVEQRVKLPKIPVNCTEIIKFVVAIL
jgi:hypothetical protein